MRNLNIYLIEDAQEFKSSLYYEIEPIFNNINIKPNIIWREDDSLLDQDFMTLDIDIILIDYDLGILSGDTIIAKINDNPQYNSIPIIFYSAGLSVIELKEITKDYGHVVCVVKDDLGTALVSKYE